MEMINNPDKYKGYNNVFNARHILPIELFFSKSLLFIWIFSQFKKIFNIDYFLPKEIKYTILRFLDYICLINTNGIKNYIEYYVTRVIRCQRKECNDIVFIYSFINFEKIDACSKRCGYCFENYCSKCLYYCYNPKQQGFKPGKCYLCETCKTNKKHEIYLVPS